MDDATNYEGYAKFLADACANGSVWVLVDEDDRGACAVSAATVDDEEPLPVNLFWADEASARQQIAGEWENYEALEIPMDTLLNTILLQLEEDCEIVGGGYDKELYGFELSPLQMKTDLEAVVAGEVPMDVARRRSEIAD